MKILRYSFIVKFSVISCALNIVAVLYMCWWSYGVNLNNDDIVNHRVERLVNERAREICNACVQAFARQQGLDVTNLSEEDLVEEETP